MISLLDVSVLIPLIDSDHQNYTSAHAWFSKNRYAGWATCPITENGLLRIVGSQTYPNSPGLAQTVTSAQELLQVSDHVFWPDDISLMNPERCDLKQISNSMETTDLYLLALAVSHGAQFVTFDRRIAVHAVAGGAASLVVLGA